MAAGYKITARPFLPNDGEVFVIADDSLGRGVGCRMLVSRTPTFDAALRREEFFRGDAPEVLNGPEGNNDSCTYEIVVCYTFATEAQKMAFQDDMQLKLPRKANLQTICGGTQRNLIGAWLRPISSVEDIGTTWIARISVVGGRVTNSIPKG